MFLHPLFVFHCNTIVISFLTAHHKCDSDLEYKLWEQVISCMKDGERL